MKLKEAKHLSFILFALMATILTAPAAYADKRPCKDALLELLEETRLEREAQKAAQDARMSRRHSRHSLVRFFGIEEVTELGLNYLSPTLSTRDILDLIREKFPKNYSQIEQKIITIFRDYAKERGVTPQPIDITDVFFSSGFEVKMENLIGPGLMFESVEALYEAAAKVHPIITKAVNSNYSTPELRAKITRALNKGSHIYLTSAVNGVPANREALLALVRMAKEHGDSPVLIRVINLTGDSIDPFIKKVVSQFSNVFLFIDELQLSPWWNVNDIKLLSKMLNPRAGLDSLWKRGMSQIFTSPQLELKVVPTADNAYFPHLHVTTGAITDPYYGGRAYVQMRTSKMAQDNHDIGVLVLEKTQHEGINFGLELAGDFNVRQVAYNPEVKGFVDLGRLYTAEGIKNVSIDTMILPDVHVFDTDQTFLNEIVKAIRRFRPKRIILHDLFNGTSVNPHEKDRLASLAAKSKNGKLDVVGELSAVANFVNALHELDESLIVAVVRSNHNDWLARWTEGSYLQLPQNAIVYKELSLIKARGGDPFTHALINGVDGSVVINKPKRVVFVGGSYKRGVEELMVELGFHGDKGANGARASVQAFMTAVDRSSSGHTHAPNIKRGQHNVGTMTKLVLDYMSGGFSSWQQAINLLSEHGDLQLLLNNDGELYAPEDYTPNSKFFREGFPLIKPTIQPSGPLAPEQPGQIDQYLGGGKVRPVP